MTLWDQVAGFPRGHDACNVAGNGACAQYSLTTPGPALFRLAVVRGNDVGAPTLSLCLPQRQSAPAALAAAPRLRIGPPAAIASPP